MKTKDIEVHRLDLTPKELESYNFVPKYLDKVANRIGWIIINFNALESAIDSNLKENLSSTFSRDELIEAIIFKMSYSQKIDALIKVNSILINAFDGKRKIILNGRIEKLAKLLSEAGLRRNRYAHSQWMDISKQKYVKTRSRFTKNQMLEQYSKFDHKRFLSDLGFMRRAYNFLDNFERLIWVN
jgi:hypothetical protein